MKAKDIEKKQPAKANNKMKKPKKAKNKKEPAKVGLRYVWTLTSSNVQGHILISCSSLRSRPSQTRRAMRAQAPTSPSDLQALRLKSHLPRTAGLQTEREMVKRTATMIKLRITQPKETKESKQLPANIREDKVKPKYRRRIRKPLLVPESQESPLRQPCCPSQPS